ncbi:cytochrome P450 monooxygenase [Aspergillus nomiae NRRL 13137]|uniref:Cytochrome P450 monooxygenase n=1 Tax=Aspergillus nomiae NRRL (strain ATCC 15546 / NRRL 13137 / CBS 260.88 / M93) TaxID=1509407 RepID=A0A0L1JDN0_ASPN3|nr:cytochrome P450 monooxygenase [Aspergillus nomiae NRRL 13137]KNG89894.1 cytochrome P450 monooxygenase [Aspergillus nomiae NRRL 13137]
MSFVSVIIFVVATWCIYVGWPWYRNWTQAKELHVPIILSPISSSGLALQLLRYILDLDILPTCMTQLPFVRLLRRNAKFQEKFAVHAEYGKLFILVTPETCELYVADTGAAKQVLSRWRDFPKPSSLLEGADWQRHRKLTARAFNEKLHEAVWVESTRNATKVLKQWANVKSVNSTRSDILALSLGVLFKACLNIDGVDKDDARILAGDVAACQSHLDVVLNGISNPMALGRGVRGMQKLKESYKALGELLTKFVEARTARSEQTAHADLLSSILAPTDHCGLSSDEVTGNLFLFMFAGHETTANALIYAIHLMAIFPAWQEWALEEIDNLSQNQASGEEIPFHSQILPQTQRLRAILYETLRLYGPVPNIVRKTDATPQTLLLPEREFVIPQNTSINVNAIALHTDPKQWGPDPLAWRPDRWILKESGSSLGIVSNELPQYLFAWGDGPRLCPGQKFSQIEVCAVLLRLFKHHRVELVPSPDQTMDQTRSHALFLIQNSIVGLTLQMPSVESVGLRWVGR